MDLFAAGLNAWGQLEFNESYNGADEPNDILKFTSVLRDDHIEIVYISDCYTISGLQTAGMLQDRFSQAITGNQKVRSNVAIAGNGKIAGKTSTHKMWSGGCL